MSSGSFRRRSFLERSLTMTPRSSTCVDTLCRTDKVCAHCTTPVDKKLPYIELKREGTGYAAGGGVQVEKFDVAFQA